MSDESDPEIAKTVELSLTAEAVADLERCAIFHKLTVEDTIHKFLKKGIEVTLPFCPPPGRVN